MSEISKTTEGLVLIGSRALHYHLSQRLIEDLTTDYDFIGTYGAAFRWLGSLKHLIKFDQIDYALTSSDSIEHDLQQWKHMDKSRAMTIYGELKSLTHITKLRGHTETLKFEIEITQPGSSAESILNLMKSQSNDNLYQIATMEVLEAIKTSHIIFPYNWCKHMTDLNLLRDHLGHNRIRNPEYEDLIIRRRIEHYQRLGVPGADLNLNKTSEDFLENESVLYVDKYIPHDDLHLRVISQDSSATPDLVPAYFNLRTDMTKAFMNKELFDQATHEVQLNCVREEVRVIAMERYLLPGRESDPQTAYTKAYIRVATTLTKGWFREFAVNAYHLISKLDMNLTVLRDQILNEHQQALIKAKKEAEAQAEQIRRKLRQAQEIKDQFEAQEKWKAHVFEQSFQEDYHYRIQHLLPLVFTDPKELKMAQILGSHVKYMHSNTYECVVNKVNLGDSGGQEDPIDLDLVFMADTDYIYDNKGWCNNHNLWWATVQAIPSNQYHQNIDSWDDSAGKMSWEYHDLKYRDLDGYPGLKLSFTMSQLADDSYDCAPDMENLQTKSFQTKLDDNFLMKFILCIIYPPRMESGGQRSMPRSDCHYLYEIWRNNQLK